MTKSSRWWAVFLSVIVVEVILLIKILQTEASISLLLAIVIVTVLIVLTLRIEDLNKVSVTGEGLQAELDRTIQGKVDEVENNIKNQVNELENNINNLLISTVLDAYEYITLKKITLEEPSDLYNFNYPKGQDLLERLRNRGLIEVIGDQQIFNDKSNREISLKEHFLITERGKRYLEVLKQKGLDEELYKIARRNGYSG